MDLAAPTRRVFHGLFSQCLLAISVSRELMPVLAREVSRELMSVLAREMSKKKEARDMLASSFEEWWYSSLSVTFA